MTNANEQMSKPCIISHIRLFRMVMSERRPDRAISAAPGQSTAPAPIVALKLSTTTRHEEWQEQKLSGASRATRATCQYRGRLAAPLTP
jgi:hypothetical protein